MSEIRDYREMQETEMSRDIESLVVKKESSECSGLLSSIDHNFTDAHAGYNVHREAFNEASVISGDQFQLHLTDVDSWLMLIRNSTQQAHVVIVESSLLLSFS